MSAVALRTALTLADVLAATGGALVVPAAGEVAFASVSIDSRTVEAGGLFVAIKGPRFDGHDFLAEAASRGAAGALVHRESSAPAGFPRPGNEPAASHSYVGTSHIRNTLGQHRIG